MIKPAGNGKVRLWTSSGSRPLGPVTSLEAAQKQEAAIKASEAKRANMRAKALAGR